MDFNEVNVLSGSLTDFVEAELYGYGSGYGNGSGYGSGYGYGNGYGYGSGYGYGNGYGYGYGNGYGSGYGDGYGDGDGSGDGSGSGYGDGSGYGSGYGDGSGYGYGYGWGYGNGDGVIDWLSTLAASLLSWTDKQRERWNSLLRGDSTLAFWKSDSQGLPSNGGHSNDPAVVGKIEKISGPLEICTSRGLHATVKPESYKGGRIWVVALHGEVQWKDDKCASLEREIVGELFFTPKPKVQP